ncbi:MAG: hypothetical protein HDS42_03960 [Bacteroides sp.]|nr:hypothetical protein [Bacteroides sp.]
MANINRFKAFEKVGKSVCTDVDFDEAIGASPNRTSNGIAEASRELNLPIDQLKNALFWFVCTCPAEEIAMRNLSAGNIDKARSIVEKFASWSAFLNYHTMSHLNGDLEGAAIAITALIGQYKHQLLNGMSLDTVNISELEFIQLYYDLISEDYSSVDILKAFRMLKTDSLNVYDVILNIISKGYVAKIDNIISIAESTPKSDSESNRLAGLTLKRNSEPILSEFKTIVDGNSTYAIIADKLALQVLQNGINYYNNTDDEDAARRIMPIFEYARRISVGQLAKERCEENYEILKKAYDELPPIDAVADIKAIERILGGFGSSTASSARSKELVLNCAPYLGILKEKCGLSHPAVVSISTLIVRKALNSVIADVNAAIQRVNNSTSFARITELSKAKNILADAWDTTLHLDQLPLHEEAKEWYVDNCRKLKDIMNNAGVPAMSVGTFRIKTEPEYFQGCKTKTDYQEYLKLFPNARYKDIAKNRIAEFERQEELERKRREEIERKRREERNRLLAAITGATKLDQLWTLHSNCKDTSTLTSLDDKAWSLCKKRSDYKEYLLHLPKGKHKTEALKKSRSIIQKLGYFAKAYKGWIIFVGIVLSIFMLIGLIWGPGGYQGLLYVLGFIGAMMCFGGFRSIFDSDGDFGVVLFMILVGGALAAGGFIGAEAMDDYVNTYNENRHQQELLDKEEHVYNQFLDTPSTENFKAYIKDYRHGKYISEVVSEYIETIKPQGPLVLNNFVNEYPVLASEVDIENIISQQCDSLYGIALGDNTRESWEKYQKAVPTDYLRDSQDRIETIDNREWNTESKAWAKASALGTLSGYYKYINMYPHGSHSSVANKKIIDMEVDNVMAGEHGELPSMDQTSYGYGPTSSISVYNNTSYTLTLSYSGPDSKRISISPHNRRSITLKNGSYRCVASVDGGGVSNHAGTESLNGGSYEVEYYISTYRTRY